MKKIDIYMRPEKLEDVKSVLGDLHINGLSISEIMGCGNQKGWKNSMGDLEMEYHFLPKIKLEIVVTDAQVEEVIDKICEKAQTGKVGDGKIFVTDIQDAIRIRTRERGISAIS